MKKELKNNAKVNNINENNLFVKFFGFNTEMYLKKNKTLQPNQVNFIKYYAPIYDSSQVIKLKKEYLISAELAY